MEKHIQMEIDLLKKMIEERVSPVAVMSKVESIMESACGEKMEETIEIMGAMLELIKDLTSILPEEEQEQISKKLGQLKDLEPKLELLKTMDKMKPIQTEVRFSEYLDVVIIDLDPEIAEEIVMDCITKVRRNYKKNLKSLYNTPEDKIVLEYDNDKDILINTEDWNMSAEEMFSFMKFLSEELMK